MSKRRRFETMADVPEDIRAAYDRGDYWCAVPPVCTAHWTDLSWINHTMNTGGFKR